MRRFDIHSLDGAPAQSRPVLAAVEKAVGFSPGLMGLLAESPAAVEAFATLTRLFAGGSLGPVEREVVLMTTAFENACAYSMAFHTFVSRRLEVPAAVVASLRAGAPLPDARLQALADFTRTVVRERGRVGDELWGRFVAHGFTRAQALEVLVAVASQTLSSSANRLGDAGLDPALREFAWTEPPGTVRARA